MVKNKSRNIKPTQNDAHKITNQNIEGSTTPMKVTESSALSASIHRSTVIFIFIFSTFIYLSTMYPSLPGGDSGELMVTASELGVAHPPGYPLFTILAKLFIAVIPYSTVAFRVNLLACFSGSLTNALVGTCLLHITDNAVVALTMCGMLGFSRMFWIWNITGEVFSLNNALCMAILLTLKYFCVEKEPDRKLKIASILALLSGLSITNQHTAILLVVPSAVLVVIDLYSAKVLDKRSFVMLTSTGLAPMLLYLQLPIASYLRTARVSWGDQSTMNGFIYHFLRRDYGTFKLMKSDTPSDVWWNLSVFTENMMKELTIPVMLCAAVGVMSVIWRIGDRKYTIFLVVSLNVYIVFFCTLANVAGIDGLYKGVLERFWLQPALYLALLAGIGLNEILNRMNLNNYIGVVMPIAIILLGLRIYTNYEQCDQSNNHHMENFGRHILSNLPNDSILLTSGDLSTNTFRYLTIAENVRPDVHVLDLSFMGSQWYIPVVGQHMKGVNFPGIGYMSEGKQDSRLYNLEMFLDANIATRPVFVCLKPRQEDMSSIKKYEPLPFSFCNKFVRRGSVEPLRYGQQLVAPNLDTYLPPRTEQYGETTWEHVLLHEYWDAMVKPGRYLWQVGESTKNIDMKKELYLAAYRYLLRAKEMISEKIDAGVISPLSWNHTSYYSKYLGVQCRQLWAQTTDRVQNRGSDAAKYYKCQRDHFLEYIESAEQSTRKHDKEYQNIVMLLQNPGM